MSRRPRPGTITAKVPVGEGVALAAACDLAGVPSIAAWMRWALFGGAQPHAVRDGDLLVVRDLDRIGAAVLMLRDRLTSVQGTPMGDAALLTATSVADAVLRWSRILTTLRPVQTGPERPWRDDPEGMRSISCPVTAEQMRLVDEAAETCDLPVSSWAGQAVQRFGHPVPATLLSRLDAHDRALAIERDVVELAAMPITDATLASAVTQRADDIPTRIAGLIAGREEAAS